MENVNFCQRNVNVLMDTDIFDEEMLIFDGKCEFLKKKCQFFNGYCEFLKKKCYFLMENVIFDEEM